MNWFRRKWCEWLHAGFWSGHVQFNIIEETADFEMRCSKCARRWQPEKITDSHPDKFLANL